MDQNEETTLRERLSSREGLPESFPEVSEKTIDWLVRLYKDETPSIKISDEKKRSIIKKISANRPSYYPEGKYTREGYRRHPSRR